MLLVFTPRFNTQDDVFAMLVTSGSLLSRVPEPHILVSNLGIGWLLSVLYSFTRAIPWYALYLLATLYAGCTAILYVTLRRRPHWMVFLMYLLLFLCIGGYALVQLQFTIAASLVSLGGLSLLWFAVEQMANNESLTDWLKRHAGLVFAGVALSMWGAMVRWEAFGMMGVCVAPMLFLSFFSLKTAKAVLHGIVIFASVAVLAGGLQALSASAYKQWMGKNMEFQEVYGEWYNFRTLQRIPLGTATAVQLWRDKGLSATDIEMLSNEFYLNDTLYSSSRLRSVEDAYKAVEAETKANNRPAYEKFMAEQRERWWKRVRSSFAWSVAGAAGLLWAAGLLLFSFSTMRQRWLILARVLTVGVVALSLVGYVQYLTMMRDGAERVVFPLLLVIACAPLLFSSSEEVSLRTRFDAIRVILGMCAILCCAALYGFTAIRSYTNDSDETRANTRELHTIIQKLKPQAQNLYVIWSNGFPLDYVAPFEDMHIFDNFHAVWLTWCQRTPLTSTMLQSYGVSDLYQSMALDARVFTLFSLNQLTHPDLRYGGRYAAYMLEHFGWNIDVDHSRPVSADTAALKTRQYIALQLKRRVAVP
jgi:hypothetical protein